MFFVVILYGNIKKTFFIFRYYYILGQALVQFEINKSVYLP